MTWWSEYSAVPRFVLAKLAIRCRFVDRFVGSRVPSRVSGQRFSTRDTFLPSVGSRRARFPVFIGVESGEGGAYHPASARSLKRLVQFSRKPLSYVGRADWRRLGRIPGTRWISRTRPKSVMRREDGYRRQAVFRRKPAREGGRCQKSRPPARAAETAGSAR